MENINIEFLNPLSIANNIIASKKIPENYGTVTEAKFERFICANCNNKNITGVTFRREESDAWEISHTPLCRDCINTELTGIPKEVEKRNLNKLMYEYWYIESTLTNAGIKDFQYEGNKILEDLVKTTQMYIKDIIFDKPKVNNLILMGGTGTGKTHIATAIARNLKEKGFVVGFCKVKDIFQLIFNSYNINNLKSEQQIITDLAMFDLLVIDDITQDHSHKSNIYKSKMLDILTARQGKPTVFTTNENEEELMKLIGQKCFSRMKQNSIFLPTGNKDFRNKIIH